MNQEDSKFIAKVHCGKEMGTGFLVNERTMITARHVIDKSFGLNESNPVFVQFGNQNEIEAVVIFPEKPYLGIDVAILSLSERVDCYSPLPLSSQDLNLGEEWKAFGFPNTQRDRGQFFKGSISNFNIDQIQEGDSDMELFCEKPQITDPNFITKGASGSPIVVNGAIIGIMKDKSPGSNIGATSIKRCLSILESKGIFVRSTDYIQRESSSARYFDKSYIFDNQFNSEKEIVIELIKDFPEETHSFLVESLNHTIDNIIETGADKFGEFLQSYRHPFNSNSVESGVEQLMELITLLRCGFKELTFIHDDINANLSLDEQEEIFAYLIFSTKRHAKMPELILELFRKKISTATGKRELRRGDAMLPFPLILDNYSKSKKVNLCGNCQKEFSFEDILVDFTRVNEQGYFLGLEKNNYKTLNKTKVLCGDCIRGLHNHVNGVQDLESYIREMTSID